MNAPVKYQPNFVGNPDEIFEYLWANLPWERREDAPRRECWMTTLGAWAGSWRAYLCSGAMGSGRGLCSA